MAICVGSVLGRATRRQMDNSNSIKRSQAGNGTSHKVETCYSWYNWCLEVFARCFIINVISSQKRFSIIRFYFRRGFNNITIIWIDRLSFKWRRDEKLFFKMTLGENILSPTIVFLKHGLQFGFLKQLIRFLR